MNDLQNKLLGGYAAVRITSKEEFEKVIEWLSIKNCFLANKEPVSKMNYPGGAIFVLYRADDGFIWWAPVTDIDTNTYQLIDVKQLELNLIDDQKIIEANAVVTSEVVELNEKVLTLVTDTKPEGATVDSNVDSLVALIPLIKSKANIVVTEENYKSFITKGSATVPKGIVPELRKWAKDIDDERKRSKKVYMDAFNTYETKVKSVVDALNNTAQKIANDVDVYVQEQKNKLRKEREDVIEKLKEIMISKNMISKEYADKFVFDEKWLNASCSNKKFQDEAENQFNNLMEQEKIVKQNLEMIENTIINTCLIAGVDEKFINREKYRLQLVTGTNLGEITKNITDEVNNAKKREEAIKAQANQEAQLQKERFEKQQREVELKHQQEIEALKKQAHFDKTNENKQVFRRGDEIIAKTNGNNVVTEIKETPENFHGKTWTKTFEFTGDLGSLQMLNRYMEFLKQSNETFDFKEVKMTEKELANKETGELKKYVVKEIN